MGLLFSHPEPTESVDSDSNLNQGSELPVTQQVFGTKLLLERILSNLKKKHLLRVRSVNHAWNAGALNLLRKQTHFRLILISPGMDEGETESAPSSFSKKSMKKLESLTKTIIRSTELGLDFPRNDFIIHCIHLQYAVVQNFLSNCGANIQNLSVSFPSKLVDASENEGTEFLELFRNMLFNQLPNIRHLEVYVKNNFLGDKTSDYFEQLLLHRSDELACVLPTLKQFRFNDFSHIPINKCILEAAVNLEDIKLDLWGDKGNSILDLLQDQGKIHLLSSLIIPFQKDLLELTERIAEMGLPLKSLRLEFWDRDIDQMCKLRAGKALNKLLSSCAQSLEFLNTFPNMLLPQFQPPLMPNLHKLIINYDNGCKPLFPTHFTMSSVFPRLETLKIILRVCERMSEMLFKKSFLGGLYEDRVETLRSLELSFWPGAVEIENLVGIFPNLVSLSVVLYSNIPEKFEAVWSLPYLRILKVVVAVSSEGGNKHEEGEYSKLALELGAALTGFSKETCEQLALDLDADGNGDNAGGGVALESLRVNSSMLDAKYLLELHITIEDCFDYIMTGSRTPILSRVACEFALKLCPQVKVHIQVFSRKKQNVSALKKDFQPVSEYVTSIMKSKWCQCRSFVHRCTCPV